MVLEGEREGEHRDRHSDRSRSVSSWDSGSGNTKLLSTSGEGDEGLSERIDSFRSPSRSAKLTRNGSSVLG